MAAFFLNLVTAVLGTAAAQSPLSHFFRHSARAVVLREYVLSIIVAFALGYIVYRLRQPTLSKWVWVAGLCWFVWGAFRIWFGDGALRLVTGTRGTIYWEMSGVGCMSELNSCWSWIEFTLPFLRTVFYSLGALCCFRIGSKLDHAFRERFPRLGSGTAR